MSTNEQWGWWTALDAAKDVTSAMRIAPPEALVILAPTASTVEIGALLQEYGNVLARLEWKIGIHSARITAFKESLDAALQLALASDLAKDAIAIKEARALAGSDDLRATKRKLVEDQTVIAALKGMRDAYKHSYDSASRLLSARQIEASAMGRSA